MKHTITDALLRKVIALLRQYEQSHLNGGDPRCLIEAAKARRVINRLTRLPSTQQHQEK